MKMIRKLPTILLIFVALLSIGFTYAEENEDGSGDIPDSTMIPITNKTGEGEEDNTSNMTTMQIIFVTSICSILTVVLLAIITIYVCGKDTDFRIKIFNSKMEDEIQKLFAICN
uniref:uncharacterized protein LOC120341700 isoform X2 n=1 Tax=Styela clava TaxID=7725 RepID=UPI00193AA5AC|nr:uncharacterized protein LOC120341700 isoform X2 [Styela clava]